MGENEKISSYQKIDYSVRPAKSIERKMICEVISKLLILEKINNYRYVGFGSVFFTDFILLHKTFGFNSMISIEKNTQDMQRFKFNKPYSCIDLRFGTSNEVLPEINWDRPVILWLDYDSKIREGVFNDIGIFCTKAATHSIIIITVNATSDNPKYQSQEPGKIAGELAKERLKSLKKKVGNNRIPLDTTGNDLDNLNNHKVLRKIILNEIMEDI